MSVRSNSMQDASPEMLSIFAGAIARPSPEERAAFLDTACGSDVELRRRDRGPAAGPRRGGQLPRGTGRCRCDPVATVDQPASERPGTVIGPYKLLEQIGEGGFGVVFMAEQPQPVRRKVALKVLKPGMDTRQVVARFEAERQALALMDHPHIAHVFDGGTTQSGRPYFVMELVRGVPITAFCDQSHLGVRERLGLFVDVCAAVQHAHQKGIIHRDLKPSNVLVTMHDDKPVVKVIDFGVAKAFGQTLTDKTLFTGFAQMIGTPLYMSSRAGGDERAGRGHAQRRLRAGRAALRAAHRHDAVRRRAAARRWATTRCGASSARRSRPDPARGSARWARTPTRWPPTAAATPGSSVS